MKEGFDIIIKDNFFEIEKLTRLQKILPHLNYSANYNSIQNYGHLWFSAPADEEIQEYLKKRCEKILNKKFNVKFCTYTMLATVEPLAHCDLDEGCDYQIIVYLKGNTKLNKGTGFYLNGDLNTHVGFNENRAIIWHANTWHTPLNWASDDKSKRFSIIMQMKEIS
jgi:hypothetical protein|tara:strand:+ start:70 stop:567 length:498 start_codon:yes stop_codon:yes gene_type:complete